jgi:hypothetical protein
MPLGCVAEVVLSMPSRPAGTRRWQGGKSVCRGWRSRDRACKRCCPWGWGRIASPIARLIVCRVIGPQNDLRPRIDNPGPTAGSVLRLVGANSAAILGAY